MLNSLMTNPTVWLILTILALAGFYVAVSARRREDKHAKEMKQEIKNAREETFRYTAEGFRRNKHQIRITFAKLFGKRESPKDYTRRQFWKEIFKDGNK